MSPGECVGEMTYVDQTQSTRTADVIAHGDVRVMTIRNKYLLAASDQRRHRFHMAFMKMLAERVDLLSKRLSGNAAVPKLESSAAIISERQRSRSPQMRAMPQKRSVLFLDFDGVLHPAGAHRGSADLARLPLLEAFLREPAHQGVQIVISSTWREAHPFERLRALFTDDLRPRILGVTPVLDEYDTDYPRHEEIKAWLDRHPDCTAWAALDDDVQGFPGHRRKTVVFTDSSVGLTKADLDALRSLLA